MPVHDTFAMPPQIHLEDFAPAIALLASLCDPSMITPLITLLCLI